MVDDPSICAKLGRALPPGELSSRIIEGHSDLDLSRDDGAEVGPPLDDGSEAETALGSGESCCFVVGRSLGRKECPSSNADSSVGNKLGLWLCDDRRDDGTTESSEEGRADEEEIRSDGRPDRSSLGRTELVCGDGASDGVFDECAEGLLEALLDTLGSPLGSAPLEEGATKSSSDPLGCPLRCSLGRFEELFWGDGSSDGAVDEE